MKNQEILNAIKEATSFRSIVDGNRMLSYNTSLHPVSHYEVADNTLFVVQLNRSYPEIKSFSEFRVNEFNKKHGTSYKLVFEFLE